MCLILQIQNYIRCIWIAFGSCGWLHQFSCPKKNNSVSFLMTVWINLQGFCNKLICIGKINLPPSKLCNIILSMQHPFRSVFNTILGLCGTPFGECAQYYFRTACTTILGVQPTWFWECKQHQFRTACKIILGVRATQV